MDKMKFVIVGTGRITTLHVEGYNNNPDAQLWGVYDKNNASATKFAELYNIPKVYKTYEEVLSDKEVKAVEIIVPHDLHCAMTIQACEAKKHVSVQKPMAISIEECDKMIKSAKDNGVKLRVFENFIFYPPYQLVKKLLADGEIGEPVGFRYKHCGGGLLSRNAPAPELRAKHIKNLDKSLKPTGWKVNNKSWTWRLNDSRCGGGPAVFDDGYHKFSMFVDLLGEVEKVYSWIDCTAVIPGVYQDIPATMMWKWKNKKLYGTWDITAATDMYIEGKYYNCDERMELTGTRGILWITRCTATMLPNVAPVLMYRDGKMQEFWDMPHDWQDSFTACTRDFIEAIRDDREPKLSGERGREITKFALAMIDSSKLNKEIFLDDYEDTVTPKKKGIFGRRR